MLEKSFLLVAIVAGIVKLVFRFLPSGCDVAMNIAGWPSSPVLVPMIFISWKVWNVKPAPSNIVCIFLSKNAYLGPAYACPCLTLYVWVESGICLLTLLKYSISRGALVKVTSLWLSLKCEIH